MKKIYRILNQEFCFSVENESLDDFDVFMERYGKSFSMEIFSNICHCMKNSIELDPTLTSYKFSIVVEKAKSFDSAYSLE